MRNDVYMFAAALYCEACGEKIRADITAQGKAPADPDEESTYDSDDFPKGPFPDGGGESDSPQHCDACHVFLENELTSEGRVYVAEKVDSDIVHGRLDSVAVTQWYPFYDVGLSPRAIRLGRMTPAMRAEADATDGTLDTYADGGYPIYYVVGDSDWCCPKCANDAETGLSAFGVEFRADSVITASDINWEDPDMWCDCGERIPSAYAEPDEDSETSTEEVKDNG
jgi:hypothetical protein